MSIYSDFAKSGGLIAYGPNLDIVYRRAAHFVDKIIKGERVTNLPVEQPVTFDLVRSLHATIRRGTSDGDGLRSLLGRLCRGRR